MSSNGEDYEGGDIAGVIRGITRAADETFGEVTGRNYERQKNNEASDLADAQAEAEAQLARERLRAQRIDVASSKTSQAIQNTALSASRGTATTPDTFLGARDFLGL